MLVHLYGVVPAGEVIPEGLTGRADRPIRLVEDDALRVVVTDVEDDARVGRADLLAHAHLLETLAESMTVIPMQFGMLMPDDDTVRTEILGGQRDRLIHLLRAFEGLVQLTVTVAYEEQVALRELMSGDRDLVALRDATRERPSDVAAQMRLGEAVSAALGDLRDRDAELVVGRLARHARAVAFNEQRSAYDVTNMALLVERDRRPVLDAAVSELTTEMRGRMIVRYVGPQPPYAFLDHVTTEEAATWG